MSCEDQKSFLYFSELQGRTVLSFDGSPVGRVSDLVVRLGDLYPKVGTVVLRRRREKAVRALAWSEVEALRDDAVVLRPGADGRLAALDVGSEEILVREDLLDKQVVDTHGAKIERVNDVHLLLAHGELRLAHVDFGMRGILRRLGWLRPVDALSAWLFAVRFPEKLAPWKSVQPLASDPRRNLKLNVTLRRIHDLHPSDIADIIEELDRANRSSVFRALDPETAAETLQEIDPRLQLSLIETALPEKVSDILESMEPDEAKEFLADLPEEKKDHLMEAMEEPFRGRVEGLLGYEKGTAGSIMTTDFLALGRDRTIADAVEAFRAVVHPLETVAYIYVIDDGRRLEGVITLRHLLLRGRDEKLGALMNPHVLMVEAEAAIGTVADVFNKYKFLAVPIVDKERVIQGIITLQDIVQATAKEL